MRTRHVFAALLLGALALGAQCNNKWVTPPVGPGTDYPCGLQGLQCPDGACCGLNDTCGAAHSRCPAGYCCYNGPSFASRDGGAPDAGGWHAPVRQFPPLR